MDFKITVIRGILPTKPWNQGDRPSGAYVTATTFMWHLSDAEAVGDTAFSSVDDLWAPEL